MVSRTSWQKDTNTLSPQTIAKGPSDQDVCLPSTVCIPVKRNNIGSWKQMLLIHIFIIGGCT
jgi:hypothetical protein